MRERALPWNGNKAGLGASPRLRVYSSGQVHTSIDRAIWVAGLGEENLVRIPVKGAMHRMPLEAAILRDKAAGFLPAA